MRLSQQWYASSGAEFGTDLGRSGYAHLKHYTAEYQEWGEGRPLILVPGLAGSYGLFGTLVRCLAEHFRVISYRLRGEDDCFVLRRRFGMPDLAQDLAELMDGLCLERPAVLGISFGGAIALEFAARWPGRIRGLVVQGVAARFERNLVQQVAAAVLARYPLEPDNPFVNQFFNLFFGSRQAPGPLFDFVTEQCWQTDQSVMAHRFRLVELFNVGNRLKQITVPTLIIAGQRDLLVSERSLGDLSRGLPQSRLVRLPDAGHLASVTHAHRAAQEVRRFLERTDVE